MWRCNASTYVVDPHHVKDKVHVLGGHLLFFVWLWSSSFSLITIPGNCVLVFHVTCYIVSRLVLLLRLPFLESPSHPRSTLCLSFKTQTCLCSISWATQIQLTPLSFVPFLYSVHINCRAFEWYFSVICFHVALLLLEYKAESVFYLYFQLFSQDSAYDLIDPVNVCCLTDWLNDQMNEYDVFWN